MQPTPLPEPDRPARLASRWRAFSHGLVVVAGWALFGWCWFDVTQRPNEVSDLWRLMIVAALLLPVVTVAWVAHNVGIHRRKGPRRAVRPVSVRYAQDFNGRPVQADWAELAHAGYVEIALDEAGVKCYRLPTAARSDGATRPMELV
ncbi:MAG: hypothetical protein HY855_00705 [Burkholderiales bacterium]|nr:hypothetical protein [Burkholderiales bacterium]